jgi:hypothetical protein
MGRKFLAWLLCSILPVGTLAAQSPENEDSATTAEATEEIAAAEPELRGIMILRVSERYLEELFARDINKRGPVYRVVLGTRARGTAHTQGRADVDTKPDEHNAAFEVRITGSTSSRTVGHNGSAIIHSHAVTDWDSRKTVRFNGKKFVTTPTVIQSKTRITPLGADSSLPRLRGRIVGRIAARRAVQYNSAAERIVNEDTRQRVLADVDRVIEERIDKLNQRVESQSLMAFLLPKLSDAGAQFSTSSDCINIVFGGDQLSTSAKVCPVGKKAPSDTELWIQTSLITGAGVKIPQMVNNAADWMATQLPPVGIPGLDLAGKLSALPVGFEVVDDWIVFRSRDVPRPEAHLTAKPVISD